ncbi:MAG: tRNA (adenosine(37)-N6)-threonylcarbamoyltransferase complex ATPase subunit type 1 TsaE [Clostridiales bacterium]|nr:tRNA (adenosine(37)-N6)-threonylcarbamoyltransferase complex ATPase subunit type 1 TsaE [Clostridiales bacterium]
MNADRECCGNTVSPSQWISHSAADTFALGEQFGRQARAGEIYCLDGDLGVGKTVFTQGFAQGLGIEEPVNSPTFTIVQQYESGRLPLYHFDLYRISDAGEMDEIGYEDCFYGEGVCLVEWAQLVPEIMPEDAVHIRIEKDLSQGFDYRVITAEGTALRE